MLRALSFSTSAATSFLISSAIFVPLMSVAVIRNSSYTVSPMSLVLALLFVWATTPFESTIDRAFTEIQNNDWASAAAALDQAYSEDPAIFDARKRRIPEDHARESVVYAGFVARRSRFSEIKRSGSDDGIARIAAKQFSNGSQDAIGARVRQRRRFENLPEHRFARGAFRVGPLDEGRRRDLETH